MSMYGDSMAGRSDLAIQNTQPLPPPGVQLAQGPEEQSGVPGQPAGTNPMFRPPVIYNNWRSGVGKIPAADHNDWYVLRGSFS